MPAKGIRPGSGSGLAAWDRRSPSVRHPRLSGSVRFCAPRSGYVCLVRRWLFYASSGVPFGITITLVDGRSFGLTPFFLPSSSASDSPPLRGGERRKPYGAVDAAKTPNAPSAPGMKGAPLPQLRFELELDVPLQRRRDRAVVLRLLGRLAECVRVESGDSTRH